jgi:hypothetical protein
LIGSVFVTAVAGLDAQLCSAALEIWRAGQEKLGTATSLPQLWSSEISLAKARW